MRLSKIYSNQPAIFPAIVLNTGAEGSGFNVVIGDVRRPKDSSRDSHNLGKTTLVHLIDFLLLCDVSDGSHFLVKHSTLFAGFEFFLEIQLSVGGYVTVRRGVDTPTKASFTSHRERDQDMSALPNEAWEHLQVPRDRAIDLLDSYLNLTVVAPSWTYRKGVTYFLRTQQDYLDCFQIQKFSRGRDVDWKPYLAHIFGFNSNLVQRKYDLEKEIEAIRGRIGSTQAEIQVLEADYTKLRTRIDVRRAELDTISDRLDRFSFAKEEAAINKTLVDEVERQIAQNNERAYNIQYDMSELERSLENAPQFRMADVTRIFEEAEIVFPDQLTKSYEQLVEFNKKLTRERRRSIKKRLEELRDQQEQLQIDAARLDQKREEYLRVLREIDTFRKFKALQKEYAAQRADLSYLERQLERLDALTLLRREEGRLVHDQQEIVTAIARNVQDSNPTCQAIAREFNELTKRVLNLSGLFYVRQNKAGNLDFKIETEDARGEVTSQSQGTSYKKLLCALFDLAVLTVYCESPFYHFVYHDGPLEGLDNRLRNRLLEVIREYSKKYRVQYILTLIDSDLPRDLSTDQKIAFEDSEVVLHLHDADENGRLFKTREF